MTEATDFQLIELYTKLRDKIAVETKAFTEKLKPYKDGMNAIKSMLMQRLIERGANHTATDHGTAYLSDILNVKIEDANLVIQSGIPFIPAVPKDEVKRWKQEHDDADPPGITTSIFTKLNIRKS